MAGCRIGIDLGASYLRVGVYRGSEFEIIPNEANKRRTPCYITVKDSEYIIGDEAERNASKNLKDTVFHTKQIIGCSYDEYKKESQTLGPLKVINIAGKPVTQLSDKRTVSALDITARLLCRAKEMAEDYLKEDVSEAVITVPACFPPHRKKAVEEAGEAAGLHVLAVIDEPSAAAISYKLITRKKEEEKIVVLRMGEGSFDIAIFDVGSSTIKMMYSEGSPFLGWRDFDTAISEHFLKEIPGDYSDVSKYLFCQEIKKAKELLVTRSSIYCSTEALGKDDVFIKC